MESFWKDKTRKLIDPDLFSGRAENLAKRVYDEKRGKANNPTQIRKFYDEVVRFDTMVQTDPTEFDAILPYLRMLNAKAAYAMGRDLISKAFKDFISDSLAQIQDRDDFAAFAGLFEAFMGFYKFNVEKSADTYRGGGR